MTNSMNGTIESIPMDLIIEILSNLPAKSVERFRRVSKLWASTLSRPYFTELFFTKSQARPRLLFVVRRGCKWCFYSSPQLQDPDDNSSLAAVDLVISSPDNYGMYGIHGPVSSLIFLSPWDHSRMDSVICNPTTGQYVSLPVLTCKRLSSSFFGYDPVGKQYKILCISLNIWGNVDGYHLLAFGCEEQSSWKSIQCPTRHKPLSSEICINGILYYVGRKEGASPSVVMVCFDVGSEKFKFLDEPKPQSLWSNQVATHLANLKGKLVLFRKGDLGSDPTKIELCLWVLENDKKQKWSEHVYCLPLPFDDHISVVGMIGTGEIVLSMRRFMSKSNPFYVFFFNTKRNTLRKVEIQGIEADYTVHTFLNHVENISFIGQT